MTRRHRGEMLPGSVAKPLAILWSATLLLVLLFTGQSVRAELATTSEMEAVCRNWLTTIVSQKGAWAGTADPKITAVQDIVENDTLLGRYYAISSGGYVVVPALKEMAPVKVYSDEYPLNIDDPEGFALMLRQVLQSRMRVFVEVYGSLEASQTGLQPLFNRSNREKWDQLAVPPDQFVANTAKSPLMPLAEVGPLLTTAWHQGSPYNSLCPDGDGGRKVAVGCVATAAAQIVWYHQWPPSGEGSHSYWWGGDNSCGGSSPGQTISADFSDPYSYVNSPAAVAEISYEVGVAFDMDYGVCGSGAYTLNGAVVFPTYFHYAPGTGTRQRSSYSDGTWFTIIKGEINQNRPILYRIYSHAIVLDGWRQVSGLDQCHFNYGWNDSHTAWYTVDNLYCPWSGCDPMVEGMVIGIVPERAMLWMGSNQVSDAAYGDGDGIPEAGEKIQLTVTVANYGAQAVSDVSAQLLIDDASITITDGSTTLGAIAAKDSVKNTADPFEIVIPVGYTSRVDSFFIVLTYNAGADVDTLVFERAMGPIGILLVDDDESDNVDTYYRECFSHLRVPYDVWPNPYSSPDSAYLSKYDVVVWLTGDYRLGLLNSNELTAMRGYLNGGGKLFLSGQGIAAQLSTADPDFLHNFLKADYLSSSVVPILAAKAGCQVMMVGDSVAIVGAGGAANQTAPDHVNPINGSVAEMNYYGQTNYGAVSFSGSYQTVFFSFGFEAIIKGDARWTERDTVLARILDYFAYQSPPSSPVITNLKTSPDPVMNMTVHTPAILWSYHYAGGNPQQSYQIQVSSDNDWTAAEMWDFGPTPGTDSTAPYSGADLVDGQTYYLRARAFDGTLWSGWSYAQFRMNSRPPAPAGQAPINMAGVTAATPDLTTNNATDGEYDALTYAFQLYEDSLITTLVAQTSGLTQGYGGVTKWHVSVPLQEDKAYFWRVRASDPYESGDWSGLHPFWVNTVNQAPLVFDLLSPVDKSAAPSMRPTFSWAGAVDPEPYDRIRYTFYLSTDSLLGSYTAVVDVDSTQYRLTETDSLAFGSTYYWTVEAVDQFGGTVYCTKRFALATMVGGDANGDRSVNIGDAVFIVNYIFKSGLAPVPYLAGDANCDQLVNIGDAVYLINYIFKGGPAPCSP